MILIGLRNTHKNSDCENDQFGSEVAFRSADIPRLFALRTSVMNFSSSSSKQEKNKNKKKHTHNSEFNPMTHKHNFLQIA